MSRRPSRRGRGRLGPVATGLAAVAIVGLLSACNDSPTEVEFEVIEEVTFDPSLNIDLAAMTKLPEGVYIQDLVAGTGPGLATGDRAWVYYELRLRSGAPMANGVFSYAVPLNGVQGWDPGMAGMMAGGARVILIPPELGYGAQGNPPVPPGAILHFRVELDSIT